MIFPPKTGMFSWRGFSPGLSLNDNLIAGLVIAEKLPLFLKSKSRKKPLTWSIMRQASAEALKGLEEYRKAEREAYNAARFKSGG